MIPPTQNTSGKVNSVTADNDFNLGCGKKIVISKTDDFFCGVPNGWGTERFCEECEKKMKAKWAEEDKQRKK